MSDFSERVSALATRSRAAERQALTEEATKTAVILPFLQTLGFDVFNLESCPTKLNLGIPTGFDF